MAEIGTIQGQVTVVVEWYSDGSGRPKVIGAFTNHEFAEQLSDLLNGCGGLRIYDAQSVWLNQLPAAER